MESKYAACCKYVNKYICTDKYVSSKSRFGKYSRKVMF